MALDRKSVKSVKGQVAVKKDDVDLIVRVSDIDAKNAMFDRISGEGVWHFPSTGGEGTL